MLTNSHLISLSHCGDAGLKEWNWCVQAYLHFNLLNPPKKSLHAWKNPPFRGSKALVNFHLPVFGTTGLNFSTGLMSPQEWDLI